MEVCRSLKPQKNIEHLLDGSLGHSWSPEDESADFSAL